MNLLTAKETSISNKARRVVLLLKADELTAYDCMFDEEETLA